MEHLCFEMEIDKRFTGLPFLYSHLYQKYKVIKHPRQNHNVEQADPHQASQIRVSACNENQYPQFKSFLICLVFGNLTIML